jgi:UDP-sulfoquinovose synthase
MTETVEIAQRYLDRYIPESVPCVSTWTGNQKAGVVTDEALARPIAAE